MRDFVPVKRSVYGGETSASRLAYPASDLARGGVRHKHTPAPHRPPLVAAGRGPAAVAHGRRPAQRCRPCVPGQGRSTLDAGCLPILAPAGVQSGDAGRRSGPRSPIRLAPQLRFAPLLLHEGRSVIYVARQLGHDARLTLTRYGHVIDELEEQPRITAESAIADARLALHVGASAVVQDLGPEKAPANAGSSCRAGRSPICRPAAAYI